MSRDQKPGRSNNIASAPARAPATTGAAPPTAPAAAPATATPAARPPLVLLAALFVIASIAGGIGLTMLVWLPR